MVAEAAEGAWATDPADGACWRCCCTAWVGAVTMVGMVKAEETGYACDAAKEARADAEGGDGCCCCWYCCCCWDGAEPSPALILTHKDDEEAGRR